MSDTHWNQVAQKQSHSWSGVPQLLKDWLGKYQPDPRKALDLGCGKGDKTRWLAELGYEVTGIDISEVAIGEAKAHSGEPPAYIVADLADLSSLELGSEYGLILDSLASQFLPLEKQAEYFSQIFSLLSPGGYLYYLRVDEAGDHAPKWVKRITFEDDVFNGLIEAFELLEEQRQPSKNLEDTRSTRLVLRKPV